VNVNRLKLFAFISFYSFNICESLLLPS